ncbi:hypothetical protein V6N13_036301 [Hibiscus sabdariffa]
MRVMSWNVRGLGSATKRKAIIEVLGKTRCDKVILQETKMDDISGEFVKRLWISDSRHFVMVKGLWQHENWRCDILGIWNTTPSIVVEYDFGVAMSWVLHKDKRSWCYGKWFRLIDDCINFWNMRHSVVVESDSVVVVSWVLHRDKRPWSYGKWFWLIDDCINLLPCVCFANIFRETNGIANTFCIGWCGPYEMTLGDEGIILELVFS